MAFASMQWSTPELAVTTVDSVSAIPNHLLLSGDADSLFLSTRHLIPLGSTPGVTNTTGFYNVRTTGPGWESLGPFTTGPTEYDCQYATDFQSAIDANGNVHCVFEAHHHNDYQGSNQCTQPQDNYIGYKSQADDTWDPEVYPFAVSAVPFSPCSSAETCPHAYTPSLFLEGDMLHVVWKEGDYVWHRMKNVSLGTWSNITQVGDDFFGQTSFGRWGFFAVGDSVHFLGKNAVPGSSSDHPVTHYVWHAVGVPPTGQGAVWSLEVEIVDSWIQKSPTDQSCGSASGSSSGGEEDGGLAVVLDPASATARGSGPVAYMAWVRRSECSPFEEDIAFATLNIDNGQWTPSYNDSVFPASGMLSCVGDGRHAKIGGVTADSTGIHVVWHEVSTSASNFQDADRVYHRFTSSLAPSDSSAWSAIADFVPEGGTDGLFRPRPVLRDSVLHVAYARKDPDFLDNYPGRGWRFQTYYRQGRWLDDSATSMTWSDVVSLDRDFVVPAESTLTIAAGTIVQVAGDDRENQGVDSRVELIVEGSLVIAGTPGNPVRISGGVGAGGPGSWYGIRLKGAGSVCSLSDVFIEDAKYGVVGEGASIALTNVTFNRCASEQIHLSADTTIPAGGAWSGLADTSSALVVGVSGNGSGGVDVNRIELVVEGDLLLGASGVTLKSTASAPSQKDWYGVRLTAGSNATLSGVTIQHARCGVALDGPAPDSTLCAEVLAAASSGSTGDNLHSLSFLRDYELTWPLTVPAGQAVGFHVQDRGESGVDTSRVELVLSGSGQLALGAGCVLRSDADAPAAGDWYGVRTAADSLLGNVLPSGPPAPAIRNARAAIAHEDPARGWPDLATLASSIAFSDNVADLGFDRDRVVDSLDARTIPAGFRLGFREVDADSVAQGGKCELIVKDGGKLVADASGGAQISIGSTVPAAAAAAGDWFGIRLLTMAEAETGYGFLACQAGCGDFCSGCDAEKSVFKNVVISDSETGLSIEGNVAPELADVAFHDVTDDRDIYLASGDVVIPVDFEWNLVAPTHVVASSTPTVADYDTTKYGVTGKIDLIAEGHLNTDRSDPGDTTWVFFEPEEPDDASATEWGGVFLSWTSSGGVMEYADFSYAENPLYLDWPGWDGSTISATYVRNCRVHHFADVGIWVHGAFGNSAGGAVVESSVIERGLTLVPTLGRVGVYLDGADLGGLSDNLIRIEGNSLGAPDMDYSHAVEAYFGKPMCLAADPYWSRTLSFIGNTLEGPDHDATVTGTGTSGFFSNYLCGGAKRTIEFKENWVHGFNYSGLEFNRSSDVQVECNVVENNARAIEFTRDIATTGVGVRFKENYFDVPAGANRSMVQTDMASKTKLGAYITATKGLNEFRTRGVGETLSRFILENEPGDTDSLDARTNSWWRNDTLFTVVDSVFVEDLVWTTLPTDTTPENEPAVMLDPLGGQLQNPCWQDVAGRQAPRAGLLAGSRVAEADGTDSVDESSSPVPIVTRISAPYPNPSRGSSRVALEISPDRAGRYRVEVFDVAGRSVGVLMDREVVAGRYQVEWPSRVHGGGTAGPGVYFVRITGPDLQKNAKLVVLR